MMRKLTTKKEQILDSALKLMAAKNTTDITVREIASEAKVNIAAINYYFKSKDLLLKEIDNLFMDNFYDAFLPLDDDKLNDEQKLIEFLKKAISYAGHYPGILVMLKEKLSSEKEEDNNTLLSFLGRLIKIRELVLKVIQPEENEAEQLFMAFGSCLLFPFIAENYMEGLRMHMSEEEHLEYIKLILNKFKKER